MAGDMAPSTSYAASDLTSPEVIANPFPAYAALRASSPVAGFVDYPPGTVPGVDDPVTAWAFLTYDQVSAALRDHRTFSSRDPIQEASEAPTLMLGNTDQPLHTLHRKLINKAFTRKRVQAMGPWLEQSVRELVAAMPTGEEIEVSHTICAELPARVICRFVGTPDSLAPTFRRWTTAFMLTEDLPAEERNASNMEMGGFFFKVCQERMAALEGGEEPGDGLIDAMILAEVDGQRLSLEEVVRFCITLMIAGAETTMYFIGNVLNAMVEFPEATEQLRADRSLIQAFIDETMRLTGPPQRLFRIANQDVEVDGQQIREGDWVALFFGAANHDPAVFPDPERFRLDRANAAKHLSLGQGIHYCLGAPLAHLELEYFVNAVLDRFARIERGPSPAVKQAASLMTHGYARLPLVFHEH